MDSPGNNFGSSAPIKLAFSDLGNGFTLEQYSLYGLLKKHFTIEITEFEHADFLIYGSFGFRHAGFKGVKIFCTEENIAPDWNACDYAFTHVLLDTDRHMRMPCYVHRPWLSAEAMSELTERPLVTHEDLQKNPRRFCNFIYRNAACKIRNKFFRQLSRYRKVDAAGPLYNNVGYRLNYTDFTAYRDPKREFQQNYKFTIAFENESCPGYQTEKLTDALRARTLPIYWGNPLVADEFDPRSYLHYSNFGSADELIEKIIEIDQNDDLLLEYLNAPILTESSRRSLDPGRILARFAEIFETKRVRRTTGNHFRYCLSQFCGRGLPRQITRFSRYLRGKR